MFKELYLLRHGQAEHGYHLDDFERKLTPSGITQLTNLASHLIRHGFYPDHVYCSTAQRTRQTIQIISEQLDYSLPIDFQEEIYEASMRTLFNLVTQTKSNFDKVLIVGHNPGLSYLYDYLTDSTFGNMNPGELVKIVFENQHWEEVSKGSGIKKPL